jgi:hypothetical protein
MSRLYLIVSGTYSVIVLAVGSTALPKIQNELVFVNKAYRLLAPSFCGTSCLAYQKSARRAPSPPTPKAT